MDKVKELVTNNNFNKMIDMVSSKLNKIEQTGKMAILVQLFPYIFIFILVMLIVVVLIYIYVKYYHDKRFRWVSTFSPFSHLISLEPHNQDFCRRIATFIRNYKINDSHKFNYDPTLSENIYFYDNDVFKNTMSKIDSMFLTASNKLQFNSNDPDEFMENLEMFINTRFDWSKSDKYKRDDYLQANIDFFENIKILTSQQEYIENGFESTSIFNYLDFDNMEPNNINENVLINTYSQYMPQSLSNYYNDVEKQYTFNSNIHSYCINKNTTTNLPIGDLLADFTTKLKEGIYSHYGMSLSNAYDNDSSNDPSSNLSNCHKEKPPSIDKIKQLDKEEQQLFEERMNSISQIENFAKDYDNENIAIFFTDHYFFIEEFIYTTFDKDDNEIFDYETTKNLISRFQHILDLLYLKINYKPIELAIQFTIHYALDTQKNKKQKLDDLCELYASLFELFIYENKYRRRLDRYNESRKPNLKKLAKLYDKTIKWYYEYFIEEMIFSQWKKYIEIKTPPKYNWVLDWIRPYVKLGNIIRQIKNIFKREGFQPEKEMVAEHFVKDLVDGAKDAGDAFKEGAKDTGDAFKDAAGAVGDFFGGGGGILDLLKKAVNFFKDIVDFLKNTIGNFIKIIEAFIKTVSQIFTEQFWTNLLENLVKFIILIFLLLLCITYGIPLGNSYDNMLLGELPLYLMILTWMSIRFCIVYIVLVMLTIIVKYMDITLLKGKFYVFLYRWFGACENAPNAWYTHGGYHYKNKNEKMIFAFLKCGENYGPDPHTKRLFCVRKYMQEPKFCPQANIFRLKEQMNVKYPIKPGSFYPSLTFMDSTTNVRKKMIKDFKKMKFNFHNHCESSMEDYNSMTKNICRLYTNLLPFSKKSEMEKLCYENWCVNGKREQFCYKLTNVEKEHLSNINDNYLSRMIFVSVYLVIFAYSCEVIFASNHSLDLSIE